MSQAQNGPVSGCGKEESAWQGVTFLREAGQGAILRVVWVGSWAEDLIRWDRDIRTAC